MPGDSEGGVDDPCPRPRRPSQPPTTTSASYIPIYDALLSGVEWSGVAVDMWLIRVQLLRNVH